MELLWVKVSYWSLNPEYSYQVCLLITVRSDPSWSIVYISVMWTESEWSRLLFQSCQRSSILGTKCHLLYVWHYTIIFRYDHVAVTQRYIQRYQLLSNQNTVNDLNSATETVVQHRVGVLTSCDVQTLRISDVWTTWAQQLYRQLTI